MKKLVTSRRNVLRGWGAVALLAACSDPPVRSVATGATADGRGDGAASDAATDSDAKVAAASANPIASITPNDSHYVTSCCQTPQIDVATWTLAILDRGKLLTEISMAQLQALPARTKEHTLECIGAGPYHHAISNAVWTGLPLPEIFAALGVSVPPGVAVLKMTSADAYTTGLPLTDLDLPVWLVWQMNGAALPPDHGYPARLLVPNRYGMKNPKWLTSIEFVTEPYAGFWETKGWSDSAVYQPNTLVQVPMTGKSIAAGTIRVAGTAFAGHDPIAAVHVRVDGGPWQAATLDYAPGADIWALWHLDWPFKPGAHTVQARCTTASGAQSLDNLDGKGTKGLGGYDGSMKSTFTVT